MLQRLNRQLMVHLFQLWAIGRITGLTILIMRYKGISDEWKLIYRKAKTIEHELNAEHWLDFSNIKDQRQIQDKAIQPHADMSEIMELAELGNADAQLIVGKAYYYGDRVNRDIDKAYFWLHKANSQYCFFHSDSTLLAAEAEYYLGRCLQDDPLPFKSQNGRYMYFELGEHLIKQAAEKGCSKAQCYYAEMMILKPLSPEKAKEAFHWFNLSANQGYPKAFQWLGYCYKNGIGIEKDVDEGHRLLIRSAELGNVEATLMLAEQAKHNKQIEEAEKWYILAANQGSIDSSIHLAKKAEQHKQYSEAEKWYKLAYAQGEDVKDDIDRIDWKRKKMQRIPNCSNHE